MRYCITYSSKVWLSRMRPLRAVRIRPPALCICVMLYDAIK